MKAPAAAIGEFPNVDKPTPKINEKPERTTHKRAIGVISISFSSLLNFC
jgi:hypothetical protein